MTLGPSTIGLALLGLLVISPTGATEPGFEPSRDQAPNPIYFFFSPEAPGSDKLAQEVVRLANEATPHATPIRPVLLLEDFGSLSQPSRHASLIRALKILGKANGRGLDIPLYDEEGLRLAKSWGIRTLPAIVLIRKGRAHVFEGSGIDPSDLKDLGRCKQ